jgi:hypothetical protein
MLKKPELSSEVGLTIHANVTDIRISLVPAASIPIVVRTEFTKKSPAGSDYATFQSVNVRLRPLDAHHQDNGFKLSFNSVPKAADSALKARDVTAGKYSLEALPTVDSVYVQSAKCGPTDLLREELVVPPAGQPPPIEIILRDDGGTVAGNVKGVTGSPATLLIVPQFAPMQLPRIVKADGHGAFQSSGLAPGDYRIFAFDSLDDIEYANPKVLDKYASRAAQVKISANRTAAVTVGLIKKGE